MAQTVHLKLMVEGNDVFGESTKTSLDRGNTIECSSYQHEVSVPIDPTLRVTGRRVDGAVTIVKRIDKSTPLLLEALAKSQDVSEALFMFYRSVPGGAGGEEKFLTVELENGAIVSVDHLSEDAIVGGDDAPPMMEKVSFTYRKITWTYETAGATCEIVVR